MRRASLLLTLLLTGCTDRAASQREQALEARVTRLEAQVRELSAQLGSLRDEANDKKAVVLAGARTCALDLARALESYKADNGRYPTPDAVGVTPSCADFQVDWTKITPDAYAFTVRTQDGQSLTEQQSQ